MYVCILSSDSFKTYFLPKRQSLLSPKRIGVHVPFASHNKTRGSSNSFRHSRKKPKTVTYMHMRTSWKIKRHQKQQDVFCLRILEASTTPGLHCTRLWWILKWTQASAISRSAPPPPAPGPPAAASAAFTLPTSTLGALLPSGRVAWMVGGRFSLF